MPIMTAIWRFFTTNKPNIALKNHSPSKRAKPVSGLGNVKWMGNLITKT